MGGVEFKGHSMSQKAKKCKLILHQNILLVAENFSCVNYANIRCWFFFCYKKYIHAHVLTMLSYFNSFSLEQCRVLVGWFYGMATFAGLFYVEISLTIMISSYIQ